MRLKRESRVYWGEVALMPFMMVISLLIIILAFLELGARIVQEWWERRRQRKADA